jgi:hypothetical protein
MATKLYREHTLWRRETDSNVVRFFCLEDVASGRFCVVAALSAYIDNDEDDGSWLLQEEIAKLREFIDREPFEDLEWAEKIEDAVAGFEHRARASGTN